MFKALVVDGKTIPLYYHQTGGGAEYLSSSFVECRDGHKEGTFNGGVLLRVDGQELEIIKLG